MLPFSSERIKFLVAFNGTAVHVLDGRCVVNQQIEDDTTWATARLPGLQIEIVHRQPATADFEQISVNLRAVPSFAAFGHFLEVTNPFAW
jgi:hypothetical protein